MIYLIANYNIMQLKAYLLLTMTDRHINCMSGALSGVIEVLVSHPIDRIKTKLQESTLQNNNISFRNTIYEIHKQKGFYIGIVPKIIGIMPMRLIYWTTLMTVNDITKDSHKYIKYIAPGLIAGTVQTLVDNPIEVMKIRLMTSNNNKIKYKELYKGFNACLLRNILFAIKVGIFTRLCIFDNAFLSGAIGGITGSFISQPFDILKTEKQRCKKSNKSYLEIIKYIHNNSPNTFVTIKKLWTGSMMRATLGCVNMGVGFLMFDKINSLCVNSF